MAGGKRPCVQVIHVGARSDVNVSSSMRLYCLCLSFFFYFLIFTSQQIEVLKNHTSYDNHLYTCPISVLGCFGVSSRTCVCTIYYLCCMHCKICVSACFLSLHTSCSLFSSFPKIIIVQLLFFSRIPFRSFSLRELEGRHEM